MDGRFCHQFLQPYGDATPPFLHCKIVQIYLDKLHNVDLVHRDQLEHLEFQFLLRIHHSQLHLDFVVDQRNSFL